MKRPQAVNLKTCLVNVCIKANIFFGNKSYTPQGCRPYRLRTSDIKTVTFLRQQTDNVMGIHLLIHAPTSSCTNFADPCFFHLCCFVAIYLGDFPHRESVCLEHDLSEMLPSFQRNVLELLCRHCQSFAGTFVQELQPLFQIDVGAETNISITRGFSVKRHQNSKWHTLTVLEFCGISICKRRN